MPMYSRLTSVSTQPGWRPWKIVFSGDVSSTLQHSSEADFSLGLHYLNAVSQFSLYSQKRRSLCYRGGGTPLNIWTGGHYHYIMALPLDPAGGHPSPDPLLCLETMETDRRLCIQLSVILITFYLCELWSTRFGKMTLNNLGKAKAYYYYCLESLDAYLARHLVYCTSIGSKMFRFWLPLFVLKD